MYFHGSHGHLSPFGHGGSGFHDITLGILKDVAGRVSFVRGFLFDDLEELVESHLWVRGLEVLHPVV